MSVDSNLTARHFASDALMAVQRFMDFNYSVYGWDDTYAEVSKLIENVQYLLDEKRRMEMAKKKPVNTKIGGKMPALPTPKKPGKKRGK